MKVTCGTEVYDISVINNAVVRKATISELKTIERKKNGAFSMEWPLNIQNILDNYRDYIGRALPKPEIPKIIEDDFDLPDPFDDSYDPSLSASDKDKAYFSNHQFSMGGATTDGTDFFINWSCEFKYWSHDVRYGLEKKQHTKKISSHCRLSEIMKVLKKLVERTEPITMFERFYDFLESLSGLSYEKIQKDILPVYEDYMSKKANIDKRNKAEDDFFAIYGSKSLLCIYLLDEQNPKEYLEDFCGFDIFSKRNEIEACLKKWKNSNNYGEKDVEYALKWFMAIDGGHVVSIKNDCESQYRYNCIVLQKPDFINEPQEYDHIIVCSAGIMLIETKHWKGNIEIRPDGKWIRKADDESSVVGEKSPKFQMRRHEVLIQKILPGVPVHSLICFSNASAIIDGRENFKDYPIITVDQLEETLTNLCTKKIYTREDIDRMVATIEAHKIYKA